MGNLNMDPRRVEGRVSDLIDNVNSRVESLVEANGALESARSGLRAARRLRAECEASPPPAADDDLVSAMRAEEEHRHELLVAHAARRSALSDLIREAQIALAEIDARDPRPSDAIGTQPEGHYFAPVR
jgi:hypothetical protein